ncbi:glutathione ABC transporter substrate-binding protein [Klebsiella pneumoniae]
MIGAALLASSLAQAKDLRIATYADATGFDPHDTEDNVSLSIQSGIFERLFQFDSKLNIIPVLATDYTANADATEYTINLRQDVTFQDGTPFNAEAVKINIERLANPDSKLSNAPMLALVKEVEVVSPYQVKILLKKPFGALINALASPAAVPMISPQALKSYPEEADLRLHPVGTGPFKLVEWHQGKDIKLEKNPGYWQKDWPKVDNITLYPISEDATRVAKLKAGEVDAIYPLPSDLIPTVEQDSKLAISREPSIYQYYIALNTKQKPLNDLRVRQALYYAIDRELWLKVGFAGLGHVAESPLALGIKYYEKQSSPSYDYDPQKARQLLKEAGYADGFDVELWLSNRTDRVRSAQFIKQQLAAVGVRVKLVPMDSGTLSHRLWEQKDPQTAQHSLYYGGWSPSSADAEWALDELYTTQAWPPSGRNASYYSSAEVDNAFIAGLQTADQSKRAAAYATVQRILWQDVPAIYLGAPDNIVGKDKALQGVSMLPDGTLTFERASFQ